MRHPLHPLQSVRHSMESVGSSRPDHLGFADFSRISVRHVWPGEGRTSQGCSILLCLPMRAIAEKLWDLCASVRGSHLPPHATSESIPLDHRPGTPSGRSNVHLSVPRACPPRQTKSPTVASSSRIPRKGHPSERFRISNIPHKHQRNAKISRLPLGHHRRFDIIIFYRGVPEFGHVARARLLLLRRRRGELFLSPGGRRYGEPCRCVASLEAPTARTTLSLQYLQHHRRLPRVDIRPLSGPYSPGDPFQHPYDRR